MRERVICDDGDIAQEADDMFKERYAVTDLRCFTLMPSFFAFDIDATPLRLYY